MIEISTPLGYIVPSITVAGLIGAAIWSYIEHRREQNPPKSWQPPEPPEE